jgi:hypothetical protein
LKEGDLCKFGLENVVCEKWGGSKFGGELTQHGGSIRRRTKIPPTPKGGKKEKKKEEKLHQTSAPVAP